MQPVHHAEGFVLTVHSFHVHFHAISIQTILARCRCMFVHKVYITTQVNSLPSKYTADSMPVMNIEQSIIVHSIYTQELHTQYMSLRVAYLWQVHYRYSACMSLHMYL